MKVKQLPEDFQVEELTAVVAGNAGQFALYRLDKTGWTTPDALGVVRRKWQIDFRRMSYGGLKDRHAVTAQYFTIFRGPRRNLTQDRISVSYLGQRDEPFSAEDISANRFAIALRSLGVQDAARAIASLAEVNEAGFPNYFDDQRFGSVGEPPEFVAKEMVFGRYEKALQLALAAPYAFDRADAKAEKETLRTLWGDWAACKSKLPRGHARSLVDYLVSHPTDFKGAVARLRPELQGLYLSAYQSYLWNRMLGEWLVRNVGTDCLATIDLKLGAMPAPRRIPDEVRSLWEGLLLPLPSARLKPAPEADWLPIVEKVLQSEGLSLPELKIKGFQKPFFSKGDRAGCIRPLNLAFEEAEDELNRGRRKLNLRFELGRGCYATMLIKRIASRLTFLSPVP
jgi:tRNA pseudouridine13 synthase